MSIFPNGVFDTIGNSPVNIFEIWIFFTKYAGGLLPQDTLNVDKCETQQALKLSIQLPATAAPAILPLHTTRLVELMLYPIFNSKAERVIKTELENIYKTLIDVKKSTVLAIDHELESASASKAASTATIPKESIKHEKCPVKSSEYKCICGFINDDEDCSEPIEKYLLRKAVPTPWIMHKQEIKKK